mgnify:FL=1
MGKLCKYRKNYIKRIIYLILVILWMTAVFFFSEQNGDESSKVSNETTKVIIQFSKNSSDSLVERINPYIRKLAHYSLYTVGGILIYLLFKTFKIYQGKQILYSFIFGFLYACSDEIHQIFVPHRSAMIRDVVIDSLGTLTGIMILVVLNRLKNKYFYSNKNKLMGEKDVK